MENSKVKSNGYALIPFIAFIVFFLGSGMVLMSLGYEKPFNQFPAVIAVYLASCVAFLMFKGSPEEKMALYIKGMGRPNILIMCTIFILAGGFATVTKTIGGVDAVVNLCLSFLPIHFVTVGMFLIGCVISFASGTSIGTVVTLAPIGISLAEKTGVILPIMLGALLSGAMFGNNLSLISDATIAAANTQNVDAKSKMQVNALLGVPALIISAILFSLLGRPEIIVEQSEIYEYNLINVLPYIVVLLTAIKGISVVICLSLGIFTSCAIGLFCSVFNPLEMVQTVSNGFLGMSSMVFLSLMIGGMSYMVEQNGGIEFIVEKIQKIIKGPKSAQLASMILVALVACCIANDTISCIISGTIIKDISRKYRVDPRKMAAIIQIIACTVVVIIPYSGVMLTLYGIVGSAGYAVSFIEAIPYTFYPLILTAVTILSVYVPFADRLFTKKPWDYENDCIKK